MRSLKRTIYSLAAVIIIVSLLFIFVLSDVGTHLFNRGYMEEARRAACKNNLLNLYDAMLEYHVKNASPPSSLSELVASGYVGTSAIRCPSIAGSENVSSSYDYFPDAWGTDRILLKDKPENHDTSRMVFVRMESVVLVLTGRGEVKRTFDSDDQEEGQPQRQTSPPTGHSGRLDPAFPALAHTATHCPQATNGRRPIRH